jgi:hypothetical protein
MWMQTPPSSTYTWQGALDYANGRNAAGLCGFDSGWRLPNINELGSLFNQGGTIGTIEWLTNQGFDNINTRYWSSTNYTPDPTQAWAMDFNSGYNFNHTKSNSIFAWPVRGPETLGPAPVRKTSQTACWDGSGNSASCSDTGQDGDIQAGVAWPAERFTVDGNCVTDNLTDLVWAATPDGVFKTWQQALDYANGRNAANLCGYSSGWRLPNMVELNSLVHYGQSNQSVWLNTQGFTDVLPGGYWSSTSFVGNHNSGMDTAMSNGQLYPYPKNQAFQYTWAVRDLAAPDISLSPGFLDFENVIIGQTSLAQTLTITNTGTADLIINTIEITGTPPTMFEAGQGATNGCVLPDATLTPGASCTLDVIFAPTAIGDQEALLYVNSNDPDTPRVQVSLSGTGIDNPAPIVPIAPSNGTTFNSCSYFAPPLFQWTLNEAFQKLEIRIFTPANPAKPVKAKIKDPATTQFQMTQALWKKVLRLAIPGEATLQWKIVGSNKGQSAVESEFFEMGIDALSPVASFTLTPPSQANLPAISWENNCATKFRVSFGPDPDFTKKKKFSFTDQNPVDEGGNFSRTLTPGQWNAVRKLVDDQVGSDIYWYVESWDIVKRYNVTKPDVFTLEP